jgi:hypothetical protein
MRCPPRPAWPRRVPVQPASEVGDLGRAVLFTDRPARTASPRARHRTVRTIRSLPHPETRMRRMTTVPTPPRSHTAGQHGKAAHDAAAQTQTGPTSIVHTRHQTRRHAAVPAASLVFDAGLAASSTLFGFVARRSPRSAEAFRLSTHSVPTRLTRRIQLNRNDGMARWTIRTRWVRPRRPDLDSSCRLAYGHNTGGLACCPHVPQAWPASAGTRPHQPALRRRGPNHLRAPS